VTKNLIIAVLAILVAIFGLNALISRHKHRDESPHQNSAKTEKDQARHTVHHHKAPHGGCLNEIGSCETGHVEVLVTDGRIEVFLLAGGQEINRSVRVPEKAIILRSWAGDGSVRKIELKPEPLELGGEKIGDCSHFAASATWLKSSEPFDAYGWLMFRGAVRPLVVHYPRGYAPSHRHEHADDQR